MNNTTFISNSWKTYVQKSFFLLFKDNFLLNKIKIEDLYDFFEEYFAIMGIESNQLKVNTVNELMVKLAKDIKISSYKEDTYGANIYLIYTWSSLVAPHTLGKFEYNFRSIYFSFEELKKNERLEIMKQKL